MGWLSKDSELEQQLRIFQKQMKATTAELDELQGVDTPESERRRSELEQQAANIEIEQEKVKEQIRESREQERAPFFFLD